MIKYVKQCMTDGGRPFEHVINADGDRSGVLARLGYRSEWDITAAAREERRKAEAAQRIDAMKAGLCPGGCGKAPRRCTCPAPEEETPAQRAAALAEPADVVLDAQRLE